MNHTFTPDVCKPTITDGGNGEVPGEYTGTVTIRMPTYDEKMAFYEAAGEQIGDGDAKKAAVPLLRTVARNVAKHIVAVNITRVSDGHKFTFDELDYDSDMHGVITEIATKLIGRFQVGNG